MRSFGSMFVTLFETSTMPTGLHKLYRDHSTWDAGLGR